MSYLSNFKLGQNSVKFNSTIKLIKSFEFARYNLSLFSKHTAFKDFKICLDLYEMLMRFNKVNTFYICLRQNLNTLYFKKRTILCG
jgi:hypothetical protein